MVSDLSEYADTCTAAATSSQRVVEEVPAEGFLRRVADGVDHAVEAVGVLAHPPGE